MIAVHCDNEKCDSWAAVQSEAAAKDFVVVAYPTYTAHYCCQWCLVVGESADAEPTEVV